MSRRYISDFRIIHLHMPKISNRVLLNVPVGSWGIVDSGLAANQIVFGAGF